MSSFSLLRPTVQRVYLDSRQKGLDNDIDTALRLTRFLLQVSASVAVIENIEYVPSGEFPK